LEEVKLRGKDLWNGRF